MEVTEMQAKPQMLEGQPRTRRAAHALIAVTFVGGPEQLYRIAVCFTDGREVDSSLTYSAATYDKAAEIGNQLWEWFNTHTITEALDEPPVLPAIQPAADLISAATEYLALAAEVRKLSDAQRAAILAADPAGHIDRRNVSTVKTLYALRDMNLGDLICRGYTPVRLDLNGRGMQIKHYLETNRNPIAV